MKGLHDKVLLMSVLAQPETARLLQKDRFNQVCIHFELLQGAITTLGS